MNLFKIKIKNTTYGVSFSFFFVVALVSVCSGTQADMLFVTLMCCALHELGHLTSGGGFFCQVNFLLGALNLLPFRYFDGGRILALLANGKVCEFFRAVFILLSAAAMIHMILHGTVSVSFAATFCFIVLSEVIY